MSRHVNKCRILYNLDWIARYSSEYWLSVISIVIQLCKKVVNKVITYSDHASFTIIISWSPTIMSILTASTPCYPDKLKNGAAPCISPKFQKLYLQLVPYPDLHQSVPFGSSFFFPWHITALLPICITRKNQLTIIKVSRKWYYKESPDNNLFIM